MDVLEQQSDYAFAHHAFKELTKELFTGLQEGFGRRLQE